MKKNNKYEERYKTRGFRTSDKIWEDFVNLKPRGKTWDQFLKELIQAINYFKNL